VAGSGGRALPGPAAAVDELKKQLRRFITGQHPADLFPLGSTSSFWR